MNRTVVAIYARGNNKQEVSTQVATLKSQIRNDGNTFNSKKHIFKDVSPSTDGLDALLNASKGHTIDVTYLTYAFICDTDRNLVRQAVEQIYIHGKSAIISK